MCAKRKKCCEDAEGERSAGDGAGCGGTWWRAEDGGPMTAMEGRCCMPILLRLTRMAGGMREVELF